MGFNRKFRKIWEEFYNNEKVDFCAYTTLSTYQYFNMFIGLIYSFIKNR